MGMLSSRRVAWIAGTATWNVLINRVVPPRWYVPANLAAAGTVTLVAPEPLRPNRARSSWAAAGAGAAAAGVVVASRLPGVSPLFDDARADPDRLAWETLVRIPLGTVVLEETLFRHALPLVTGEPVAAVLFGLWHVLPTLAALDINDVDAAATRMRSVTAGVAATAAAALPLCWLRRKGGLLAPMLTHWAVNATAYAVASHRRSADP